MWLGARVVVTGAGGAHFWPGDHHSDHDNDGHVNGDGHGHGHTSCSPRKQIDELSNPALWGLTETRYIVSKEDIFQARMSQNQPSKAPYIWDSTWGGAWWDLPSFSKEHKSSYQSIQSISLWLSFSSSSSAASSSSTILTFWLMLCYILSFNSSMTIMIISFMILIKTQMSMSSWRLLKEDCKEKTINCFFQRRPIFNNFPWLRDLANKLEGEDEQLLFSKQLYLKISHPTKQNDGIQSWGPHRFARLQVQFADAVCFESTNTLAKCQRLQDVMYEFISQHMNVVKHFIKT